MEAFAEQKPGITLILRDYRDGDLDDAWYAIAATDDPKVNAAVVAEAERRRIFCVRADAGREGTAVTPASLDYRGLLIGVLAGGEHRRSAAVRSAIRRRCTRAGSPRTWSPAPLSTWSRVEWHW